MLVGIETFQNASTSTFDMNLSSWNYDYVEHDGCVLGMSTCDNEIREMEDEINRKWDWDSVWLAKFNNNMQCGNIHGLDRYEASHIKFYKRKANSNDDWILFYKDVYMPYKENIYHTADRLAVSSLEYEYAIAPVVNGQDCEKVSDSIKIEFEGLWLVDMTTSVALQYDLDYGSFRTNQIKTTHTPMGRKYPIIVTATANYVTNTIKTKILSASTIENGIIDYGEDRLLIEACLKMMFSPNAKFLKNGEGRRYIVDVSDVTETPALSHTDGLIEIQFTITEVGDADSTEDLIENGLLPNYR